MCSCMFLSASVWLFFLQSFISCNHSIFPFFVCVGGLPPTQVLWHTSVGKRCLFLLLRGKLFKQHVCLMLFPWMLMTYLFFCGSMYLLWLFSYRVALNNSGQEFVKHGIISQNDRLASLHKTQQTICRRVFFNYPPFLLSTSLFLVGLLSAWTLSDCLPTNFLKSSQGYVLSMEWTKKFWVMKTCLCFS